MKKIILLSASVVLFSCGNKPTKIEESKPSLPSKQTCYSHSFNNDIVNLSIKDSNNNITGTLEYLPYEKDGTIGVFNNAYYKGDTLFCTYTAEEEGQTTIYEMAMLKVKNSYILTNDIWGGSNYKFDTTYTNGKFIDKSKITFTGDTLQETNCNSR